MKAASASEYTAFGLTAGDLDGNEKITIDEAPKGQAGGIGRNNTIIMMNVIIKEKKYLCDCKLKGKD